MEYEKELITSLQNKTVKHINSLKQKKYRDIHKMFIVEGKNFVSEIHDDWEIEYYAFSETFLSENNIDKYSNSKNENIYLRDDIFKHISDTVAPQGILAVCRFKEYDVEDLFSKENAFLIFLEGVSDPGNMGTLIRTANAAGANGVLISSDSVDVYSPKAIRGSAGALFNIPVIKDLDTKTIFELAKTNNIAVISTDVQGKLVPYEIDLTKSALIVIGNEARGVSEFTTNQSDYVTSIPMIGNIESLNASVAGGILMYEVVRQRLNIK